MAPGGAEHGDAGVLLPERSLAQIGPAARAAVLDLIGQLVAVRPVPPDRVQVVDVVAAGDELVPLLQWVP
jgi:sugar/nucleoside kinase (ribokinase family)